MTPERDAMLRAILEHPSQDVYRMAFADWCEEHGEGKRAAVIRATAEWRDEWNIGAAMAICQSPIEGANLLGVGRAVVRLGFVAEITLTLADFMKHAGAIFRAQPVVSVRLSDRKPLVGFGDESGYREWWWYLTDLDVLNEPRYQHWLPIEMKSFFECGKWEMEEDDNVRRRHPNDGSFHFDSAEAAHAALSAACVSYARQLAGLPPLEAVTV